MQSFWKIVAKRSLLNTAASLGLGSRDAIMIKFVGLLAVLFVLRFLGSEDASNDEMLTRVTLMAVAIGLFPALFLWNLIIVPGQVYTEERLNTEKANTQVASMAHEVQTVSGALDELSKPNFVIEIRNVILSNIAEIKVSRIIAHLEVINRGTPSAALESTWRLNVVTDKFETFEGEPITLSENLDVEFPEKRIKQRYIRSDGIDIKASKPIPRLGYATGILVFNFPGLPLDKLQDDASVIFIHVSDANLKEYTKKVRLSELKNKIGKSMLMPQLAHPHPLDV